jgi:hypothetical protein
MAGLEGGLVVGNGNGNGIGSRLGPRLEQVLPVGSVDELELFVANAQVSDADVELDEPFPLS